jgi:hypothetical protein
VVEVVVKSATDLSSLRIQHECHTDSSSYPNYDLPSHLFCSSHLLPAQGLDWTSSFTASSSASSSGARTPLRRCEKNLLVRSPRRRLRNHRRLNRLLL